MSNKLRALLARVEENDPATAKELRRHVEVLMGRRQFGLNFERHIPEQVALVGRSISVGDKVRFIPPRGEATAESDVTWRVTNITGPTDERVADLFDLKTKTETTRATDELVYVADFRDPIYPGLVSTGKIEKGDEKPFHAVINSENYHALEALLFAHQGQVDCIYIDPPYNTRANDWKYNNNYVDPGDNYAHSKWLAFMERRLKLAKKLLNPSDSILVVTIDEKEVHRLGLLLQQIFPGVTVQMVTIVSNPLSQPRGRELSRVEEYAFFLFIGSAAPASLADDLLSTPGVSSEMIAESDTASEADYPDADPESVDEPETGFQGEDADPEEPVAAGGAVRWERLLRGGVDATRHKRRDLFYPVFLDPLTRTVHSVGNALPEKQDRNLTAVPEGTIAVWPLRTNGSEGRWRCSPQYFRTLLSKGYAKVGRHDKTKDRWTLLYLGKAQIARIEAKEIEVRGHNKDGSVILGPAPERQVTSSVKTVWNRPSHKTGEYGTALLGKLVPGRSFPYPKSLYAVEDTLRIAVAHRPDALVLDFFAGSGTTAHAVMRLNHQDGGRRRSISITNNEVNDDVTKLRERGLRPGDPGWEALGICEYVTKPRITAAVTGITSDGEPITGQYKFTDLFPMSDGFEENVEFFTLTYENPALVELNMAFERIAPLLWMRAGNQGRRIKSRNGTFDIADTYAVLFNVDASRDFLAAVDKVDGLRIAFIVTDDETQYQAIATQLPGGVESVRLYESYLRTFEINTGRG